MAIKVDIDNDDDEFIYKTEVERRFKLQIR